MGISAPHSNPFLHSKLVKLIKLYIRYYNNFYRQC